LIRASLDGAPDAIARAAGHLVARDGGRLLLVVDHFETMTRQPSKAARAVVQQLLEATRATGQDHVRRVFVLLVMRDDGVGGSGEFAGLASALAGSTLVLQRPTAEQFEQMICEPARAMNWEVSRALLAQLLQDCTQWPHPLAQLEHALARMATFAQGTLDLTRYAEAGCPDAIDRHGDEVLLGNPSRSLPGLSDEEQALAQRVFCSLVDYRSATLGAAPAATVSEVTAALGTTLEAPAFRAVLAAFGSKHCSFMRLTPEGELNADSRLELSHPALLTQWRRLRRWTAAELCHVQTFRSLVDAALAEHHGSHVSSATPAALLVEPQLSAALDWWTTFAPTAAWAQRHETAIAPEAPPGTGEPLAAAALFGLVATYLERSLERAKIETDAREREQRAEQLAKLKSKANRQRLLIGAALATVVAAMSLIGISRQRDVARTEAEQISELFAEAKNANQRLRLTEQDLSRQLATREQEVASLRGQLQTVERERATLADTAAQVSETLETLRLRHKEILRAHDAALIEAKAAREDLALVRSELGAVRALHQSPARPPALPVEGQPAAAIGAHPADSR
jgi:hypothetical protein